MEFLEKKLKSKVNADKSIVAPIFGLKYLGFTLRRGSYGIGIGAHSRSKERIKNRVRQLLTKNNSTTMEDTFRYLTSYLRGRIGYCGLADINGFIRDMVKRSRRKVRAKYLKQWKRTYRKGMNIQKIWADHNFVRNVKLSYKSMWTDPRSGLGIWRLSNSHGVILALSNKYLESVGFPDTMGMYQQAHERLTNRPLPAGTVGGVRGR